MSSAMQETPDPEVDKVEESDPQLEGETSQTPEETSSEQTESDAKDKTEKELDPFEALEVEVAKWKDQAIRTAAELDNYRKRMAKEKLDSVRYGNQRLLEELLPVLDNFDMGMQAAAQEEGSMLYLGMDMVRKQLNDFLSSQNVEEIAASEGGDFDPALHEALSQEASDSIEPGKIIRISRKGYKIGERLLRPSNVVVAENPEADEQAEESEQPESD